MYYFFFSILFLKLNYSPAWGAGVGWGGGGGMCVSNPTSVTRAYEQHYHMFMLQC